MDGAAYIVYQWPRFESTWNGKMNKIWIVQVYKETHFAGVWNFEKRASRGTRSHKSNHRKNHRWVDTTMNEKTLSPSSSSSLSSSSWMLLLLLLLVLVLMLLLLFVTWSFLFLLLARANKNIFRQEERKKFNLRLFAFFVAAVIVGVCLTNDT